jgi:hypothetical protein
VRGARQHVAEHDRGDGLAERQAEHLHREHADEDRGELHVGRGPRPEQLARPAVAVGVGHPFVAARLDRDDLLAVHRSVGFGAHPVTLPSACASG